MKYIITVLLILITLAGTFKICTVFADNFQKVTYIQNREECGRYAARSHEKEFSPERWLLVKQMGWTKKMWFDACMNNLYFKME